MEEIELRSYKLKTAILYSDFFETNCEAAKEVFYNKIGRLSIEIYRLELQIIRKNKNSLSDN